MAQHILGEPRLRLAILLGPGLHNIPESYTCLQVPENAGEELVAAMRHGALLKRFHDIQFPNLLAPCQLDRPPLAILEKGSA